MALHAINVFGAFERTLISNVAVTHTFYPRFPNGYLAWVVISLGFRSGDFSGYTANSYPTSTFDLAVFIRKFNSSWRSRTAKRMVKSFFPVVTRSSGTAM